MTRSEAARDVVLVLLARENLALRAENQDLRHRLKATEDSHENLIRRFLEEIAGS